MKRFYFTETIKPQKPANLHYGVIYHVTRNELVRVCDYAYRTDCSRDAESEVMNVIIEVGALPKKYHGYYSRNSQDIFRIEKI